MNCGYCFDHYRKTKAPPACSQHKCPIEDIADDLELNRIIDTWMSFKLFGKSEGYREIQEKMLRDTGLSDEPELLAQFESILSEYLRQKQKQKEQQSKTKSTRRYK